MGRVILFSISNLCVALVALVGLAVYTAHTQAGAVRAVSAPAEQSRCGVAG
jgi:hypothetical protein